VFDVNFAVYIPWDAFDTSTAPTVTNVVGTPSYFTENTTSLADNDVTGLPSSSMAVYVAVHESVPPTNGGFCEPDVTATVNVDNVALGGLVELNVNVVGEFVTSFCVLVVASITIACNALVSCFISET